MTETDFTTKEEKLEESAWYIRLKEFTPRTAEEIRQFELDYPDAKGEVILMMKARLFGWFGL